MSGFKRNRFSKPQLLVFVIAFSLIGYLIFKSFAAPNPSLPGDLNNDNTVNVTDLSILLSNYGTANTAADINGDASVNILDLSILLSHYGQNYTPPPPPAGVTWGMAGGYTSAQITDLANRGIKLGMVEMSWASAEPSNGVYDENYFTSIKNQISQLHSAGFQVILNYGMHHAPGWVLSMPNARFVNEYGQTYTASDESNMIFAKELRPYAETYTAKVFSELGTNFYAVRVGGGHFGEMQYPGQTGTDGKWQWWAFDGDAIAHSPVSSYKPCSGSSTQAGTFLNYYLDSVTDFQNWQVSTVRKAYPGKIAVLYASWGMRAGDFDATVQDNLCGNKSAEINGEVQRGFDHSRHINALSDTNVAVWDTWTDNPGTVSYLSQLASAKGLVMMGENSGEDDYATMQGTVNSAKQYNFQALLWIRASEAYCLCSGYATIDNYSSLIQ